MALMVRISGQERFGALVFIANGPLQQIVAPVTYGAT